MNSNDLSLFVVLTGVRGGNKTLLMTHLALEASREALFVKLLREYRGNPKLHPRRKVNVWANYPVRAICPPYGTLQPQPLDVERLILWKPEYRDGWIFWDEIDQQADRQDWQSTLSKFLTAGVQLMRHRNLSFCVSLQSLGWLNARLQWQADVIVRCRDLAFSQWGRERNLPLGNVAETIWIDKSGMLTGRSYEETHEEHEMLFFGERYHRAYESQHEFDIAALKTRFKIKSQIKEINVDTGESQIIEERERVDREAIQNAALLHYYNAEKAGARVSSNEFWKTAEQYGFKGDRALGGKYLVSLGVDNVRSGGRTHYVLDNIETETLNIDDPYEQTGGGQ